MASSEKLDELVARARAVFESKHGSSEGCFAAFSPAKVNVLGDAADGGGGLALQITIDCNVVVYGRGRVLPEHHFPAAIAEQERRKSRPKPTVPLGVERMAAVAEHGGGGGGGGRSGGVGLPKWAAQRRKNAGQAVDTIVQDLVFGRHSRSRSANSPAKGKSKGKGGEGNGGVWMKNGFARAALSKNRRAGDDKGGGRSSDSTPVPTYASGSSTHDSVYSSGASLATTTVASSGRAGGGRMVGGGNADLDSNATTPRSGATHDGSLPQQQQQQQQQEEDSSSVAADLSPSRAREQGYSFSAGNVSLSGTATTTSGSTSTDETFPLGSSTTSSIDNGSKSGRGSGSGSDTDKGQRGEPVESPVTDGEASGHSGNSVVGGESFSGVIEAAAAALEAAEAAAGMAPEPLPLSHPLLSLESSSTDVGGGGAGQASPEAGGDTDRSPLYQELPWQGASEPSSLYEDFPPPPPLLIRKEEDSCSLSDAQDQAVSKVRPDPEHVRAMHEAAQTNAEIAAFNRALEEAVQANAEIEAAEAADREATRLRTSRVFCEACPDDGLVEFEAKRGMHGGGGSWKGLLTAVAAEYTHELPQDLMMGIEAVVVSNMPGSAVVETSSGGVWEGESVGKQEGEEAPASPRAADTGLGNGYGWGTASRCALLMASATFFEEVLEMERFPRMKAMRCFSAYLRCAKAPNKEKAPSSSAVDDGGGGGTLKDALAKKHRDLAASAPYALDRVVERQGTHLDAVIASPSTSASASPAEIRMEDLLAIAGGEPPGAQLVDLKWRTCWHIPVSGPGGSKLAVIIAQPRSVETAERLLWQVTQKRARGHATCRAVIDAAREQNPEARHLRDVPQETLDALVSGATTRGVKKKGIPSEAPGGEAPSPATGAASLPAVEATKSFPGRSSGAGAAGWASAGGGTGTKWRSSPVSPVSAAAAVSGRSFFNTVTGGGDRQRMPPHTRSSPQMMSCPGSTSSPSTGLSQEMVVHARYLATEIQRVLDATPALASGDMEVVGRLMMQSRRSAGLGVAGHRTKQEPLEPAASRLASMISLLPGVYGCCLSEGPGSAALGAVVALVDAERAEGVLRSITTRGAVTTGVAWGGIILSVGRGSGVIHNTTA